MKLFNRLLDLRSLLKKKSYFLFGPRSTGKTFLAHQQIPNAKFYDLLDSETYGKLARRPKILEEESLDDNRLIVIDEIQRLPELLYEVQRLIQLEKHHFLLTGSSSRKLKRGGANLLGGRAWMTSLFPLCSAEIPEFNLLRYLNRGGLPHIYQSEDPTAELKNYVHLYLREEIQAEALTRNIGSFARFLDIMGIQNGEELNFQNIASDAQVPARTVQNFTQILEDTLIGFQVPPYERTKKRKAITRSKFFLFDIGVANTLAHRGEIKEKSELFGKCFEHFIVVELRAYLSYKNKDLPLCYWRSTSGFEVDIVIGDLLAIEIKSTNLISERHLRGLKALKEEALIKKFAVVSLDSHKRRVDGIDVYPWKEFLSGLWADELI